MTAIYSGGPLTPITWQSVAVAPRKTDGQLGRSARFADIGYMRKRRLPERSD